MRVKSEIRFEVRMSVKSLQCGNVFFFRNLRREYLLDTLSLHDNGRNHKGSTLVCQCHFP